MSIGAFGAFLGGLSQGQQQAAAEAQRQQYLNALLAKQAKADQDEDTTNQALFKTAVLTDDADSDPGDSGLTGSTPPPPLIAPPPMQQASMPGAVPMQPGMGGPPPGQPPMPGQASVPNGPPPQMAPQMRAAPQQMPPPMPAQAPPQGGPMPAAIPGSRPMGPPPQGMPMPQAGPPQGAPVPQAPPAAPQTPEQMVAASQARIQQLQQELDTPVAQRLNEDPGVKSARKAMHNFVLDLQKNNIGTGPGQQKPDAVQMKELQILHSNVELAATKAGKEITSNVSERVKLVQTFAQTAAQLEHAKMVQESSLAATAERGTAAAARASGTGGSKSFDEMSPDALKSLAEDYSKFGPQVLPWARSRGQDADIVKFNNWRAANGYGASGSTRADYKADTRSQGALQQTADAQSQRYNAMDKNMGLLMDTAKAYKPGPNTLVNDIANKLRSTNDPRYTDFMTALQTVRREYGKLADGGSGAAAAHVDSLKMAGDLLNGNLTYEQLQHAVDILKKDGSNVVSSYADQLKQIKGRTGASTQRGSAAPASDGDYKGHSWSAVEVDDLAKKSGKTPAFVKEMIESKGGTVGN